MAGEREFDLAFRLVHPNDANEFGRLVALEKKVFNDEADKLETVAMKIEKGKI
jgi:hypothetical protein